MNEVTRNLRKLAKFRVAYDPAFADDKEGTWGVYCYQDDEYYFARTTDEARQLIYAKHNSWNGVFECEPQRLTLGEILSRPLLCVALYRLLSKKERISQLVEVDRDA